MNYNTLISVLKSVNKDSNLNQESLHQYLRLLEQPWRPYFLATVQGTLHAQNKNKSWNTLNFMPSGVTCDIRIRKHKKSSNAVYALTKNSLMSYTTYFCSTAQVSFRVPPASVMY